MDKKKRHVDVDVDVDVDAYAIKDRSICLTFPSDAHAHSDFAPYLEELKKLLFPSNRNTFDQIGSDAVGEIGVANLIKVCLLCVWYTCSCTFDSCIDAHVFVFVLFSACIHYII